MIQTQHLSFASTSWTTQTLPKNTFNGQLITQTSPLYLQFSPIHYLSSEVISSQRWEKQLFNLFIPDPGKSTPRLPTHVRARRGRCDRQAGDRGLEVSARRRGDVITVTVIRGPFHANSQMRKWIQVRQDERGMSEMLMMTLKSFLQKESVRGTPAEKHFPPHSSSTERVASNRLPKV